MWDFHDYPGAFSVYVKQTVKNQKIVFEWASAVESNRLTVEIDFEQLGDDITLVTISEEGDFSLTIEDNGKPFQSQHTNSEGRGLANMRARAGLIDARIAWEPRQGGGTVFTLKRAATADARQAGMSAIPAAVESSNGRPKAVVINA